MARIPRKELIDQTEVGVYHCVQRAVRRAEAGDQRIHLCLRADPGHDAADGSRTGCR